MAANIQNPIEMRFHPFCLLGEDTQLCILSFCPVRTVAAVRCTSRAGRVMADGALEQRYQQVLDLLTTRPQGLRATKGCEIESSILVQRGWDELFSDRQTLENEAERNSAWALRRTAFRLKNSWRSSKVSLGRGLSLDVYHRMPFDRKSLIWTGRRKASGRFHWRSPVASCLNLTAERNETIWQSSLCSVQQMQDMLAVLLLFQAESCSFSGWHRFKRTHNPWMCEKHGAFLVKTKDGQKIQVSASHSYIYYVD